MEKVEYKVSRKIKGRGVFAAKNIKKGETVEVCPLLLVPISQKKHLEKTLLKFYYFDINKNYCAIIWGYGSLYNHSYNANAVYELSAKKKTMEITAIKNIKKGEEIFINYNYYPNSKTPLETWFDPNFKDLSTK